MQERCEQGQAVAQQLLATPERELDITVSTIKHLCEEDFKRAAKDGSIGARLCILLRAIRTHAKVDTQAIEGTNRLVTLIGDRTPNISIDLLSARVALKKALGLGKRKQAWKWKDVRPSAEETLHSVVPVCDSVEAESVLGDVERLAPVVPRTIVPGNIPQSFREWTVVQPAI